MKPHLLFRWVRHNTPDEYFLLTNVRPRTVSTVHGEVVWSTSQLLYHRAGNTLTIYIYGKWIQILDTDQNLKNLKERNLGYML